MTSHIVGDALTRTETFSGWTVTVAEYSKGVARIDHRPRLTQVVVSDQLDDEPGGPAPCYAAAACTPESELPCRRPLRTSGARRDPDRMPSPTS